MSEDLWVSAGPTAPLVLARMSSLSSPPLARRWGGSTLPNPPNLTRPRCSDIPGPAQMAAICPHSTPSGPGTRECRPGRGMCTLFTHVPLWCLLCVWGDNIWYYLQEQQQQLISPTHTHTHTHTHTNGSIIVWNVSSHPPNWRLCSVSPGRNQQDNTTSAGWVIRQFVGNTTFLFFFFCCCCGFKMTFLPLLVRAGR